MTRQLPSHLPVSQALRLAFDHHQVGHLSEAEAIYTQILRGEPNNPHALHLMGLLAHQRGQYQAAAGLIGKAIEQKKDVPDFYTNLGLALRAMGNAEQALQAQRYAAWLAPDVPEIRMNLGAALKDALRFEEAVAEYRYVLARSPGHMGALKNLSASLERLNQIDEAKVLVEQGLRSQPLDPFLNLIAAKLDRRSERVPQGIARLEPLLDIQIGPRIKKSIRYELGLLYDRSGDIDRAFGMFTEANRIASEIASSQGIDMQVSQREISELSATLTPEWIASWEPGPEKFDRPAPVFIVGFPRSGTTLLEQILKSHSRIRTLDEVPLIGALQGMVSHRFRGYPQGLAELRSEDTSQLREAYFQKADSIGKCRQGEVLIDKLPLNIISAPLIHRVFPDARFIFALRHPADAVLSCFMQDFTPNSAMANFYRLDDAARFYDSVMRLWQQITESLPIAYHAVKYENIIDDFEREIGGVLRFMGLDWEESVRHYQQTARRREGVSTPSYHQVTEPIYKRARGRWKRYAAHLKNVYGTLTPWINDFGYSA
jgi:tetratricopeptide (TPR) repeat protein